MPAASLLDRRLLFVTGKGGAGKTTVASALAIMAAERGMKVLACEVDAKGDLASFLEGGTTSFAARELHRGLWAMSMDTEASLREYLTLQLHLPFVARIGPVARALDFVAAAAPGVREILTVGKLCYEVREGRWDIVVVDASASGHVVSELAAPQAIKQLVKVGPVRHQTGWMLDILSDHETTGVCLVATPEEMPVAETIELAGRVASETTVGLAAVVVNRVLPALFSPSEEEVFRRIGGPQARCALSSLLGGDVDPLLDAAELALSLQRTRWAYIDKLRAAIDPSVPMIYVPQLFARSHGLRTTRQVAAVLAAEMAGAGFSDGVRTPEDARRAR